MPTEAPTKPKHTTWREWAPDAPEPMDLLTREELLARLAAEDAPVTGNQLRNWQTAGLVPYPIRSGQGRGVYAYYPPWMVEIIHALRDQLARKRRYPDIRAALLLSAPRYALGDHYGGILDADFPPEIKQRLAAIADDWGGLIGRHIRYVEVSILTDEHPEPMVFGTPIPDRGTAA